MALSRAARGLRISRAEPTLVEDVSCRDCPECLASRDYWCSEPAVSGTRLGSLPADASSAWAWRWITALCALADADVPAHDTVLLLTNAPSGQAVDLVRTIHPGLVLGSDGRDTATRETLAGVSATGRAQVAIALHDARTAVRSVERGGTVCLPDGEVESPTVTELVQRDVRLLGPATLQALTARGAWPAIFEGLAALHAIEAELAGTAE